METYDERLGRYIDAWVEDQLAASPGWAPEQYASIRRYLEGGSTPAVAADE
ncbi:hypothetical protein [Kitasatospora purpeofusca]|uniref:DUF768 domain-containing protein n=1 Tax=Kitasatospora purpeofusca TaxID=67352 RepID=A0ABZ1U8D1_9ACTN|nr:hypothetical protein [Kitasatospora purpeofusca]